MMPHLLPAAVGFAPPLHSSLPPDEHAACAALNFSAKVELMHGFGLINGYSRNSGCGDYCGRKTFRWDNGPQGFGDNTPAGCAICNSNPWLAAQRPVGIRCSCFSGAGSGQHLDAVAEHSKHRGDL